MDRINIEGQRFGRWTVIERDNTITTTVAWRCRCECGVEKTVRSSVLRSGKSKSCGCLRREICVARGKASRKHGMEKSPEYAVYHNAKHRCTNENSKAWEHYGGRGIEFRFTSFEQFITHIGKRLTAKHCLDRINNDGHYEVGNVRWATIEEQNNNCRKRGTPGRQRLITHAGKTMNIRQWAAAIGIHENVLTNRLRRGWTIERIITTPLGNYNK